MIFEARVAKVLVGVNPNSLVTSRREIIEVVPGGIIGDKHFGLTRGLDVRDRQNLKEFGIKPDKGIEVYNWRKWSAVSMEELAVIAAKLGIPSLSPALLGANLCFEGIPTFTQLPKGTMMYFPDGEVVLTVEDVNQPCVNPGQAIAHEYSEVNPAFDY